MNQIREELHESIGVPPLSTIDLDRTMSRMRRVVRMRRITGTAAAAVAVVGLSLSLVAYAGTSSTGERGAPPLTSGSPSVTASPAAETEQAKVARLNAALGALTRQAMPGAQFVADLPQHPVGPFEFYVFRPQGVPTTSPYNYLRASADVHDNAGVGTVSVIIGRTLSAPDAEWWCDTAGTAYKMAASAGGPLGVEGDIPPGCTGKVAWAGIRLGVFGSCTEVTDRTSCAASTGPHGETVVTTTRQNGTSSEAVIGPPTLALPTTRRGASAPQQVSSTIRVGGEATPGARGNGRPA